ncbi:hypothetical protein D3C80_1504140 [compost metagenome]
MSKPVLAFTKDEDVLAKYTSFSVATASVPEAPEAAPTNFSVPDVGNAPTPNFVQFTPSLRLYQAPPKPL